MSTEVSKPVALVSMPTLSARFPSFQLALLKPTLERAGIPVQTFSLFMYFGTHIGWRVADGNQVNIPGPAGSDGSRKWLELVGECSSGLEVPGNNSSV
jgi:hypothetical protein